MRTRTILAIAGSLAGVGFFSGGAPTARGQPPPQTVVLIRNARIFDGRNERLQEGMSLLVEGRFIKQIAPGEIVAPPGAVVVDAGNRVLMPGLIDTHVHLTFGLPLQALNTTDPMYLGVVAARNAEDMLLRGFTSVRDLAGPVFGIKKAIDEGLIVGPRIYPSGAMISQTSGHFDFRTPVDPHPLFGGQRARSELLGAGTLADGEAMVLAAVREQLRHGASQIKLAAGGGVASPADPLDVNQYTAEELRAGVKAAEDWGTYVATHVYNPVGIRRALDAGVKSIEHGHLIDEPTMKHLAAKDAFLSTQIIVYITEQKGWDDRQKRKQAQALAGANSMMTLAKKYGAKVTFGTDIVAEPTQLKRQNEEFGLRLRWFAPVEILRQATSTAAELLALSGPRNPYPDGPLGVIKEGAYADLLIVEGDPLEDVRILERPSETLLLIMKDGRLHKNKLK